MSSSAPRLTFLYPHLFRRPLSGETSSWIRSTAASHQAGRPIAGQLTTSSRKSSAYHTTSRRRQYQIEPTASYPSQDRAIPLPQPGGGGGGDAPRPDQKPDSQLGSDGRSVDDRNNRHGQSSQEEGDHDEDRESDIIDIPSSGSRRAELDAGEAHPAEPVPNTSLELSTQPLERVLHMKPPTSSDTGDGGRAHHLQANPYVHHFDTYSLVRDLQNGGFSGQQSISLMKAVRGLLASNMQLARDELVSKSDVENEGYLFRAACSELKTEVINGRRSAAEKMRSERAHLQHEVDILGQQVTQETTAIKDEIKGLFDDRKMSVRTEQRSMESKIQELNYKIQSMLTGQSKGEVEALRWFLTRRVALFLGGLAVTAIIIIQYSVRSTHQKKSEKKKQEETEAEIRRTQQDQQGAGSSASRNSAGTPSGESTDALLSNMDTNTGQNYVSLG